jgi:hypothetical protein
MTPEELAAEALVEEAASAYRASDPRTGALLDHPAWRDLDADGRKKSFAVAVELRDMEAALDPDGLSTTGRAVLARILKR